MTDATESSPPTIPTESKTPEEKLRERLGVQRKTLEEQVAKHEEQKLKNAKTHCRCRVPVMTKAGDVKCNACLKPFDMVSMTLLRQAVEGGKKAVYGTSGHRKARVDKFQARVKREKEKRQRAKKNRRRK